MTKAKGTTKRIRRDKEDDEVLSVTLLPRKKTTTVLKPKTLWNDSLVFHGPVSLSLVAANQPLEDDDFAHQLIELNRVAELTALAAAPIRLPLLPPVLRSFSSRKTLVLDIDETLVHSELEPTDSMEFDHVFQVKYLGPPKTVGVKKRPFVEAFIQWCGENFELVTFTSSIKQYADQVIDWLDPQKKAIKYRLYRDSCTSYGEEIYLKNLEHLRRDMERVLIVDNSPLAFACQIDNGVPIESFYGMDPGHTDMELVKLKNFLESVLKVEDVRPLIRKTFKLQELASKVITVKDKTDYSL
eukprot:g7793.t1